MKIVEVRATDLEIPYEVGFRPSWRPGHVSKGRRFALVAVRTEDGIVGYSGTDGHHAKVVERDVAPYLVGEEVSATEKHIRVMRNAGGAWFVDLALWDVMGKAAGLPLYKLWGWARDSVPAYASASHLGTLEDRSELALRYREEGFRAMKIRFHHERIDDDLALLDAVLSAVPGMEVMVDANQATDLPAPLPSPVWDYRRAYAVASELEQRGVVWLEEPLSRYDFDNLVRLRENTLIHIAGGEYNRSLHEFRWMIERGVYDVVQADCTLSEGVSQVRKIAGMAEMFRRHFVPHHGLSGLGLSAALHLACSTPGMAWLELMYEPPTRTLETYQMLGGILQTSIWIDGDGEVRPPEAPGLGIEVDERAIEKYAV